MENLNDRERKLVRLAFTSTDPDLRRRAVERVMTARYRPEFLQIVLNQRFRHPETGNMVTWKSLPSQAQKGIYNEWQQAQEARGEGGGGGGGDQREEGGGADRGRGEDRGERGQKYADRKALYSTRHRKADDAKADIGEDSDLAELAIPDRMSDEDKEVAKEQLGKATFADLKKLRERTQHALDNPEGQYRQTLEGLGYTEDSLKKLGKSLDKEIRKSRGKRFHQDVLEAANAWDLEEEDADVLEDFRRDKPARGRHHSWPELFQKFLNHRLTKPETKERMREMSVDDFKKMYLAILKDEDEDVEAEPAGRQASAREDLSRRASLFDQGNPGHLTPEGRKLVRLAYHSADPEVRTKLLRIARTQLGK